MALPINSVMKSVAIYGLILGVSAFALQWLQLQHAVRLLPIEIYVIIIALAFTALGIWAGRRLTPNQAPTPFEKNEVALKALGVTAREFEVLVVLAKGQSNKQIARSLGISPNTVKTHITNLFQRLSATQRLELVQKARELQLIP